MKKLIILALLLTQTSQAIETDKAAHFGISYAANTFAYGWYKNAFRMDKKTSKIFAAFTTIMFTTAAEYMDSRVDGGDIAANVLGTAASTGTILMFDF